MSRFEILRAELKEIGQRATPRDRRRLSDGYDALSICTTDDLGQLTVRELEARGKILSQGVVAMQSLDDLGPGANAKAWAMLVELERVTKIYRERAGG